MGVATQTKTLWTVLDTIFKFIYLVVEKSLTEFEAFPWFCLFLTGNLKKLETLRNTIIDNMNSREYKFHLYPSLTVYTEVSHRMMEWTLAPILPDKVLSIVSRTI